jgi:leucyl-tRNA synthetase
VRSRVVVPAGAAEDEVKARALADPKVAEHVAGKTVHKVMVVPGRLVSVVVK